MRVLSDAFTPLGAPLATSIFLPKNPSEFPPQQEPKSQFQPAAAAVGSTYFVVFQDDNNSLDGSPDIHLRSIDATFTALESSAIAVNGSGGEMYIQSFPTISAGPNGLLLVAWQDEAMGKIFARTIDSATLALGEQLEISSGTGNSHVSLASNSGGWFAVWEGGTDVKLRSLNEIGRPKGAEQVVNEHTPGTQDHPSVATLGDGRFAVVWSDHTAARGAADIMMQRYAADVSKVSGDQNTAVNTTLKGDQTSPQIASTTGGSGSFVIVWLDTGAKDVRARLAGGKSGFLFNNVDGQPNDFRVSIASGRPRANPTVVVGGAGPSIAIGWEDTAASAPYGILARRFPIPTE